MHLLKDKTFIWVFDWKSQYNPGDFYASFHSIRTDKFREFCGMPLEAKRDPRESIRDEIYRRAIPMNRAILAWILSGGLVSDERPGYANEYNGTHQTDVDMDRVYEVLETAGYVMKRRGRTGLILFTGVRAMSANLLNGMETAAPGMKSKGGGGRGARTRGSPEQRKARKRKELRRKAAEEARAKAEEERKKKGYADRVGIARIIW